MRGDSSIAEERAAGCCDARVLGDQVTDAEASDGLSSRIEEKTFGVYPSSLSEFAVVSDGGDSLLPERNNALLPALSSEEHLGRGLETQIGECQIDQFLHTCPGVVHKHEQGAISCSVERDRVGGVDDGVDFIVYECFDHVCFGGFVADSADAFTGCDESGFVRCKEAEKAFDGVQTLIPGRRSIAAFLFQIVEKIKDDLLVYAFNRQLVGGDFEVLAAVSDEQIDTVAVAGNGVFADAFLVD